MTKYNTLKKPQNYPNFYEQINNLPSGFSLNKNDFKKVITYVVSSDDEADTEAEYQIGLAQKNVITLIVESTEEIPRFLFIIKVHPNIYGVNGYPGMEESIKFYNQLELTSHNKSNLIVLGKNSEVNPYNLIENLI